jgi:Flp pilus assembly protein TadD
MLNAKLQRHFRMARIIPSLAAVLLCSTALAGCSTLESLNPFGGGDPASDKLALEKQVRDNSVPRDSGYVPGDLNSGVRAAHELRMEGKYDEASRILSQLMLVASDDPRVVTEYGKTLLQRGRLEDAAQFLTRAAQLQSGDWTTWSALGVTYDQMGNQASAKFAYDRAVALAPNEASVLSNYALSRLLANDVAGARALAARAASAGGAVDPKIARNIAMIEATAPAPAPQANAAPAAQIVASTAPLPAPVTPVQVAPVAPPAPKPVASAPQPISTPTAQVVAETPKPAPVKLAEMPKPATPAPVAVAAPRIQMPQTATNMPAGAQQYGAVVQAIPVEPAPIKLKPPVANIAAAAPPTILPSGVTPPVAKAKPVTPAAAAPMAATPVTKVAEAPKPAPVKPAPVPVKTASAVTVPVKPEAVAPVAAKPVEQAKPAPVKTSALVLDGVPALRLASDATTP